MGIKYKLELWADEAVDQMRFPPDRKVVWRELMDHMEDAWELHMERGLTNEEAQLETIRAMGDPVETGKLLNKAHRPWLGWLWWASKWLAIALAVLLTVTVFFDRIDRQEQPDPCDSIRHEKLTLTPLEAGLTIRDRDYTYEIDHGEWHTFLQDQERDVYWLRLLVDVKITAHGLWQDWPKGFDDLQWELPEGMQYELLPNGLPLSHNVLPVWELHLSADYLCENGEHPEWIRLYVPGSDFDITVYATGEVRHEK